MAQWTPTLLRAGRFLLDAGCMFGIIPRVVWSKWFPTVGPGAIDGLNRMPLQQNCLLLESGGRLVLIETGIGDKFPPKERSIYAQESLPDGTPRAIHHALAEKKARPEDISAVIVTHLHFDHAGGLTRLNPDNPERPALTFPNAEVFVQQQELDDALANRSTMNKTYLSSHLTPEVRERFRPVRGEAEVLPGVTVFPTPGHTWGQQCIRFTDAKGRTVCFVSDVMPTARHARATTNLAYDVEPYTSMLERMKLLERAEREGWVLVLDHDPDNAAYAVNRDPENPRAFALTPATL